MLKFKRHLWGTRPEPYPKRCRCCFCRKLFFRNLTVFAQPTGFEFSVFLHLRSLPTKIRSLSLSIYLREEKFTLMPLQGNFSEKECNSLGFNLKSLRQYIFRRRCTMYFTLIHVKYCYKNND